MSKPYKKWSKKEKLAILKAAEEEGVVSAGRKHEVSTATSILPKNLKEPPDFLLAALLI